MKNKVIFTVQGHKKKPKYMEKKRSKGKCKHNNNKKMSCIEKSRMKSKPFINGITHVNFTLRLVLSTLEI